MDFSYIIAVIAVVVIGILFCAFLGCFEICMRLFGQSRVEQDNNNAEIEFYALQQRLHQKRQEEESKSAQEKSSFSNVNRLPSSSHNILNDVENHLETSKQSISSPTVVNKIDEREAEEIQSIVVEDVSELNKIVVIKDNETNQENLLKEAEKDKFTRQRQVSDPELKLGEGIVWARDLRAMEEKREITKEDSELMETLKGHGTVLRMLRKAKFEINADQYREEKAYRAGVKVLKLAVEKYGFEKVHACIHKNDQNQNQNQNKNDSPYMTGIAASSGGGVMSKSYKSHNDQEEMGLRLDMETGRVIGIIGGGLSDFKEVNPNRNKNIQNQNQNQNQDYSDENSSEWYEDGRGQEYPLNKTEEIVSLIRPLDAICGMISCGPPFYLSWTKRGHSVFPTCCRLAVRTVIFIANRHLNEFNKINDGIVASFNTNDNISLKQSKYTSDSVINNEMEIVNRNTKNENSISIGLPLLLWFKCCEFLGFNYFETSHSSRQLHKRNSLNNDHNNKSNSNMKGMSNIDLKNKNNGNMKATMKSSNESSSALSRLVFQSTDDGVNSNNHLTSTVNHNKMMDVVEEEDDHIKGVSFSTRDGEDIDTSGRSIRMRNMSSECIDVSNHYVLKKKNSNSKLSLAKITPPTTPPPSSQLKKSKSKNVSATSSKTSIELTSNTSNIPSSPTNMTSDPYSKTTVPLNKTIEVSPPPPPRGNTLVQKWNPTPPSTPDQPPIEKRVEHEPSAAHAVLAFLKKAASLPNSEAQVIKLSEGDSDDTSDVTGSDEGVKHRHHKEEKREGDQLRVNMNNKTSINALLKHSASSPSFSSSSSSPSSSVINKSSVSDEERWVALASEWAGLAKRALCASDPPSRNLGAQLLTTLHGVSSSRHEVPLRLLTLGRGDDHRLSWLAHWQCPKCTLNNRLLEDLECPVCGLEQPEGLAHRVALRELLNQWSRNPRSSSTSSSHHHNNMNLNYSRSRTVSISTHQSTGVPSTTGDISTNDENNSQSGVRSTSHSNALTAPTHHNAATRSLSSWLAANTSFFPDTALQQTSTSPDTNQKNHNSNSLSNPSASPIPTPQPTPTTNPIQAPSLPKIITLEKKTRTTFL